MRHQVKNPRRCFSQTCKLSYEVDDVVEGKYLESSWEKGLDKLSHFGDILESHAKDEPKGLKDEAQCNQTVAEDFNLPFVKRNRRLFQRCIWAPQDHEDHLHARREEAQSMTADADKQAVIHEDLVWVGLRGPIVVHHARVHRETLCLREGSGVVGWWHEGD